MYILITLKRAEKLLGIAVFTRCTETPVSFTYISCKLLLLLFFLTGRIHIRLDCYIVPEPGPQGGATNTKETSQAPQQPSNTVITAAHSQDVVTTQQVMNRIADWYIAIAPRTQEGLSDFLIYMEKVRKVLVVDKASGSLIITVECSSQEILDGLWQDYLTGHLNEMAQQLLVTEDILREFGLLEVKLKITILEAEYLACRKCFLHFQGEFWCLFN